MYCKTWLIATSHIISMITRRSAVYVHPATDKVVGEYGTCRRHMIQGMMKYRGSTKGAVTTDRAVVRSQITMKLIRVGDFVILSASTGGLAMIVMFLFSGSSVGCARD